MTTHDPSLVLSGTAPRAVLHAHDRAPADLADLPTAAPIGPALSPRDAVPPILEGGAQPPAPRAGLWGASALVLIALAWGLSSYVGTFPDPPDGEEQAAAAPVPPDADAEKTEDEEAPVEQIVIQPVLVPPDQLPLRVQEQFARAMVAAAAMAPGEENPHPAPDAAPEPLPNPAPAPVPASDIIAAPAMPAEIAPEAIASSAEPTGDNAPAGMPPPYSGTEQDGVEMAAIFLANADAPDQVGAWLAAGLAEVWVKSADRTFSARPGAGELDGTVTIARADATGRQFEVKHVGALPAGFSEAALAIALTRFTGSFVEIDEVLLVLTPEARAMIEQAQARAVTQLAALGQMPAEGVMALDLTICLDALRREAALAAVRLAGTAELLPIPGEC